jgi:uncharacterized protein (TIGR03435 family)
MKPAIIVVSLLAATQPSPVMLDVVSVREHASDVAGVGPPGLVFTPGRLGGGQVTVAAMFAFAYDIPATEVTRLIRIPASLRRAAETRFDVAATLSPAGAMPSSDERRRLILSLLETRFGLRARVESRLMPVYAVRLATGTLGPHLKMIDDDCEAAYAMRQPVNERPEVCRPAPFAVTKVVGAGTLSRLLLVLQPQFDRLLLDETGVRGNLAWNLTHNPITPSAGFRLTDDSLPGTLVALREQLGLAVEGADRIVGVHVVDALSMPAPN